MSRIMKLLSELMCKIVLIVWPWKLLLTTKGVNMPQLFHVSMHTVCSRQQVVNGCHEYQLCNVAHLVCTIHCYFTSTPAIEVKVRGLAARQWI